MWNTTTLKTEFFQTTVNCWKPLSFITKWFFWSLARFLYLRLIRFTQQLWLIINSNRGANWKSKTDLQWARSLVLFLQLALTGNWTLIFKVYFGLLKNPNLFASPQLFFWGTNHYSVIETSKTKGNLRWSTLWQ